MLKSLSFSFSFSLSLSLSLSLSAAKIEVTLDLSLYLPKSWQVVSGKQKKKKKSGHFIRKKQIQEIMFLYRPVFALNVYGIPFRPESLVASLLCSAAMGEKL